MLSRKIAKTKRPKLRTVLILNISESYALILEMADKYFFIAFIFNITRNKYKAFPLFL